MSAASDRRLPATPRRREAARRQGAMPNAALPAWVAAAVVTLLLLPWWARSTLDAAVEMIRDAIVAAGRGPVAADEVGPPPLAAWIPTAVVIVAAAATGLAVRFLLDGFAFRPARLAPDLRRLDPRAGLARIFSRTTLGAIAGNALGLGLLVGAAALASGPLVALLAAAEPAAGAGRSWEAARRGVAAVAAAAAIVAAGHWILARLRFERSIRMTPEEYAAEARSAQADPKVRLLHQRRSAAVSRPPARSSRSDR